MLLPSDVGRQPIEGQECLRPIHTDEVGNVVHVEYIRPIRLTVGDFMNIYNMSNTIKLVDNSTGVDAVQTLNLTNYHVEYSYFSEEGEFTKVARPSDIPPFPQDNKMVARIELTSK
jgi:type IV secretory pathway VirB6-like protein